MKKFLFISLAILFLGIGIPSVAISQDTDNGPVESFTKKAAPTYVEQLISITNEYQLLNAPDVLLFSEGNVDATASIVPTEALLEVSETPNNTIDANRQIRMWCSIKSNYSNPSFTNINWKHKCNRNCLKS